MYHSWKPLKVGVGCDFVTNTTQLFTLTPLYCDSDQCHIYLIKGEFQASFFKVGWAVTKH